MTLTDLHEVTEQVNEVSLSPPLLCLIVLTINHNPWCVLVGRLQALCPLGHAVLYLVAMGTVHAFGYAVPGNVVLCGTLDPSSETADIARLNDY